MRLKYLLTGLLGMSNPPLAKSSSESPGGVVEIAEKLVSMSLPRF